MAPMKATAFTIFALCAIAPCSAIVTNAVGPVQKVVGLLMEMKAQVEKDTKADDEAYEKYQCWCATNKKEKDAAVEAASTHIAELEAFVEKAVSLQAELKTDIEKLASDLEASRDSLASATAIKEKETAAFQEESKEMKEVIGTLEEAVAVLAKVQLLQREGRPKAELKPLFAQLRQTAHGVQRSIGHIGEYQNVMQRDLWDVLSSIGEEKPALRSRSLRLSALERRGRATSRDEPLVGEAAGVSSYNAASGQVLGLLKRMKDEFSQKLSAAEKEEADAMAKFQEMRAAKLSEIDAMTSQKEQKEYQLSDNMSKEAQAKDDIEATKAALSSDQQFLLELEKGCKASEDEYADRSKLREEELLALGDAIKILSEDDARDLFTKSFSLLQADQHHATEQVKRQADAAKNAAVNKAMKRLLRVAHKRRDWVLASLAVRVRLDGFTKVKEVMDKMVGDLKAQQKAEYEKREFCKKEIDEAEDSIKVKEQEKDDLEGKQLNLEGTIATLKTGIEELNSEVVATQASLKAAGEQRKAQNANFQQAVSDQRATINILNKALARLKAFYSKKSMVQVRAHMGNASAPGEPNAPPPAPAKEYTKSGGAGGVLQLLNMIISDAARAETQLVSDEQSAQESYAALARDSSASVQAAQSAIVQKTQILEEAMASKSETEGALLTTGEETEKLSSMLKGLHLDCDFLLKFFDVRQQARSEEIGAITEAKAILSGAKLGQAMEEADDAATGA